MTRCIYEWNGADPQPMESVQTREDEAEQTRDWHWLERSSG